ncbi:hypothetical protein N9E20_02790 [Crocinitomicaceae bacterium]|nr:hypothetical protein [Crocinitomicaceae bacterium]
MFTQLLHYVQDALNKGHYTPPFLCVIDTQKAAIMSTEIVLPFLAKKTIKWGKSASNYTSEALDAVSAFIGTHFVSFKIETHEEEFIDTLKTAISSGEIIRTQITPDNLKQVFDKWIALIGIEIEGINEDDYALLFFADIMHDGTVSTHKNLPAELLHKNNDPLFSLGGKMFELGSTEGYRRFWAIYHRPPKQEYRDYLLERRDSLIPTDERSFKGAFYTPLKAVDKAYDKLAETLGKNWQKNYIIWDMCCGVGNLEVKHSNHRNIYMSTLDSADIDVMKATKTCVAAERFQYDFLNDDISDDGKIDYSLTNKVPLKLRQAISEGKKILILINPPYGETGSGIGKGDKNKKEVEQTKINALMKNQEMGYSSKELFIQFLVRIANEIPTATIAIFSKLKYVNAPNFEKFRAFWKAEYQGGFVIQSKAFDGLKGEFPIGFLIWKTNMNPSKTNELNGLTFTSEIVVDVLDKNAEPVGEKSYYSLPKKTFLNAWIRKPKTNDDLALPLANAVKISDNPRMKKSCDGMIGYLYASNNDLQHAGNETLISSTIYTGGNGGGLYITPDNVWQSAVLYTVRRVIKKTWLNDRDQFLQPNQPLSDEFKNDCLVWMLFNGSNLTASADNIEWNDEKWSIVNHFIPFTEAEVNAPERFESDFMVQYLSDKKLSKEAKKVLKEGRAIWQAYFSHVDSKVVRDELRLNRADVGWYQLRNAIKKRNESGDFTPVSFKSLEQVYKLLSEKIQPQVYSLGFLKQ